MVRMGIGVVPSAALREPVASYVCSFTGHPFTDQLTLIVEYADPSGHVTIGRGDDVFLLEENIQRDVHAYHQIDVHISDLRILRVD